MSQRLEICLILIKMLALTRWQTNRLYPFKLNIVVHILISLPPFSCHVFHVLCCFVVLLGVDVNNGGRKKKQTDEKHCVRSFLRMWVGNLNLFANKEEKINSIFFIDWNQQQNELLKSFGSWSNWDILFHVILWNFFRKKNKIQDFLWNRKINFPENTQF